VEAAVRDLNYGFRLLSERNKDGSYSTRSNRDRILSLIADQLWERGFKKMTVNQLGGRHVTALLERWRREELSTGTIKNRMAAIRWWAEKVGRASVVARDNASYGIEERSFVTNESKAATLADERLAKVKSEFVRFSLRLQEHFGLRREEAIKLQVSVADKGDKLSLKASWTKGGRPRDIPVRTEAQRRLLNEVHTFCGKASLIPGDLSYIQQVKIYERQCIDAGLNKMHGLRHAYAQARYEEMAGWKCPAAGGPSSKKLTAEQKTADQAARLEISSELGHEREQITAVYLGR
jgi:site-specific recombinase XerC